MPLFVNAIWNVPIINQVNLLANNYELGGEVSARLLLQSGELALELR